VTRDGPVAVMGAGSWGTALANLLARKGVPTILWSYEADVAEAIERDHLNPRYLSEVHLEPALRATTDVERAVDGAATVVSVSPSHVVRDVMSRAADHLAPDALVVSASKGIEFDTLKTMDAVLADVLPDGCARRATFLSGPSFALEVARGHPTAVTLASHDMQAAAAAQELFNTPFFRAYTNTDVLGVELGGALKNVIAIAAGVVHGMGYGHNTMAALITRGLAEITRLGLVMGADALTFSGLAGMGDLILTCTGGLSRNRQVGIEVGKGRAIEEVLGEMTMVAEGVRTAHAARALAQKHGVEMPIVEEVYRMLYERRSARAAVENLMLRSPKPEQWS
jgi:glycerol-3-phosphate dehydrogenase (NAD(P)+)